MAAYTFRAKGTASQVNGACTAGAPAGVVAGDLLLLYEFSYGRRHGSDENQQGPEDSDNAVGIDKRCLFGAIGAVSSAEKRGKNGLLS